jgi:ABC-type multidrug transport system fused ATPase/permease subunit
MKWLILLFTILKPFFATGESTSSMINPIEELKDMIKTNAVKVVTIFMAASALATMFAAGIVIIAVDIGAQYDQNAYVYSSSMIMMGLVLVLLPIIVSGIGIKIFHTEGRKQKEREVLRDIGTSHPLQDALALLIHDFVKERELKRDLRGETTPPAPRPHHPPHAPHEHEPHPDLPRH